MTKAVTTADESGSAVVKPGETFGNVTNDGDLIDAPGGRVYLLDGNSDVKVDGDGNMTVPRGSVIRPAPFLWSHITVGEKGATMDRDGNIMLPGGGSAQVGDTTVTVPEGGTITPHTDGSVDLPANSTFVDQDGNEHTVPPYGGKLDGEGNFTANTAPSTPNPSGGNAPPAAPSKPSGGFGGGGGGGGSSGPSTYPPAVPKSDNGKVKPDTKAAEALAYLRQR